MEDDFQPTNELDVLEMRATSHPSYERAIPRMVVDFRKLAESDGNVWGRDLYVSCVPGGWDVERGR